MARLGDIAHTVGWAAFSSALGFVTGGLVDSLLGSRLDHAMSDKNDVVNVLIQFSAGVAILGEILALIVPKDAQSPISDGLMFYWFFESQPRLQKNVRHIEEQFNGMLKKSEKFDIDESVGKVAKSVGLKRTWNRLMK
jgi:hypothetical protein